MYIKDHQLTHFTQTRNPFQDFPMAPHFKKLSTTTSSSMSSALSLLFSRSSRTHFLVVSLPLLFLVFFFFFTSQTNNSSASFFSISTLHVRLLLAASYVSPFSSITSSDSCLVSDSRDNCTLSSVTAMERRRKISRKQETDFSDDDDVIAELSSCDIFDGNWVVDDSDPIYPPGSCPFVDDAFNCFKNGRPDMDYIRYKWKPHGCQIPRFDGRKMLGMLRGKRVVFVGDSLNRNMWESLVCGLRESLENKSRIFEVSGRTDVKFKGFYSFKFMDYECSVEFIKAPFLVEEWKTAEKDGNGRETLRLDRIHATPSKYHDADIIIFNTGHWWTHQKTNKGKDYFQEGSNVYSKLEVSEAYTKALQTWAKWVDANINSSRTRIFFRGYSASHFRRGEWNSGGQCHGERQPITNETHLAPYPWMMNILESVISEMKTPVFYLNVTKLTDYRKDGHPSIYRRQQQQPQPEMKIRSLRRGRRLIQDCSHWCLPGVPDSWNQLLYSTLLLSPHHFSTSH